MALVTDQQETMFSESEEAAASFHEEQIHNEVETAEDSTGEDPAGFDSLDFAEETEVIHASAEPEASIAAPLSGEAPVLDTAEIAAPIAPNTIEPATAEPVAAFASEEPIAAAPSVAAVETISHEPEVAVSAPAEAAPPEAGPAAVPAEPAYAEAASAESVSSESAPAESAAAAESLPILTAADFTALEERVLRAVSLVRREREARIAAEEHVAVLEGRIIALQLGSAENERLKEEIETLRAEREQVRLRVERLLGQLDSLEF